MGYPGDQSQSGGWPPEQPSQPPSPYAPGQSASPSPYGQNPFSPPLSDKPSSGQDRPADSYEPYDPYGPGGGTEGNPYASPGSAGNAYEPGDPYGAPGPFGERPTGPPENSYASGYETPSPYGSPYSASGQDGHDTGRGGPTPPERSKLPLIIGGIVGAVVIVGGGLFLVTPLGGGDSPKKNVAKTAPGTTPGQSNAPTAAATQPTATTGPLGAKLKSRASDPKPLTLGEIFKRHAFGKYVLAAEREDTGCTKVVHGAKFAAALKSGGCTQLLRGTFRTTDGKLIGTVGVANLKSEAAAQKVKQAGGGKDAWLLPLPGSGTTKKIGKGSALGTADVRGHYVLLSWVQRPDGKSLTGGQQGTVSTFVSQVMLGSNLSTALQYRGISGKPYGT